MVGPRKPEPISDCIAHLLIGAKRVECTGSRRGGRRGDLVAAHTHAARDNDATRHSPLTGCFVLTFALVAPSPSYTAE